MLASWEDMEILDHFNFVPKNLFAHFTFLSYIKMGSRFNIHRGGMTIVVK